MPGYSATPLWKKLGFKAGFDVYLKGAPPNYNDLVQPIPDDVKITKRIRNDIDIIHLFVKRRVTLEVEVPTLMQRIKRDGVIWVSWPKRASKVETDITEDTIREIALPLGLVDIKVCAVDDTWSGLKLVIRKSNR